MNKKITSFSLIVIILLFASCNREFILDVFNNTGGDITVISSDRALVETRYFIISGGHTRVKNPYWLIVDGARGRWSYYAAPISAKGDYVVSERLGPLIEKFQIEANGFVYILSRESNAIVNELPNQPLGYPLMPQKIEPKNH